MSIHLYPELEQGSDEWLSARCGIVTASAVGKLLTAGLKVADNETSRGLTLTLTAERITGYVDPTWVSADMERGSEEEPLAREHYAEHYAPVEEIGFMVNDDFGFPIGYSPDGLVGTDGLIEIKSRRQKTQVSTFLVDEVPAANMAQLQCGLLVSGRKWIDYCSYAGGMPMYVRRVLPDPAWQGAILAAVATFEERSAEIVAAYTVATDGLPLTERTPDYAGIEF
ncbi:hypothetical protein GCM10025864_39220 [Luteimicrobium album]|uniref:YqaJ viral recombinase domain-containing protein n=1 Tax=Luteimicrobium album TaxID=1054550 RepID=A0ABQ6I7N7_9MICO|nr:lambda exonuclease family protein [Luteimicrobium album]GMA26163.1 hypothetical protein GCM10025864_39220 [Luteimicrobium album]